MRIAWGGGFMFKSLTALMFFSLMFCGEVFACITEEGEFKSLDDGDLKKWLDITAYPGAPKVETGTFENFVNDNQNKDLLDTLEEIVRTGELFVKCPEDTLTKRCEKILFNHFGLEFFFDYDTMIGGNPQVNPDIVLNCITIIKHIRELEYKCSKVQLKAYRKGWSLNTDEERELLRNEASKKERSMQEEWSIRTLPGLDNWKVD
jgi:hypothetical protein